MIKLSFMYNREILHFFVKNKEIFYTDRKWKALIRCLPKSNDLKKAVINSRNKIPHLILMFENLPENEKKEYDEAKDDNELAEIIIRDCKGKGLILLNREDDFNELG